ncbi:hypothetical protein PV325_003761 [Microctonus aethiopoides]|nr:hypothetical protein PV325_003761 [Microctonus aethiopoides]
MGPITVALTKPTTDMVMMAIGYLLVYLGLEQRLSGAAESAPGSPDSVAPQIGAGVIGPASAERNCKSSHLTIKQQGICSRSPPILQVSIDQI